jgi:hypothetical protein
VTAIHKYGESQMLCEQHSKGYSWPYSLHFSFGIAGTDMIVTFKVALWSFLCNATDMFSQLHSTADFSLGPFLPFFMQTHFFK